MALFKIHQSMEKRESGLDLLGASAHVMATRSIEQTMILFIFFKKFLNAFNKRIKIV